MSAQIIIYGAEWCGFCHAVRRYLDDKGIKYEYRDVDQSMDDLRAAVEKSGQSGIPVIDIDGIIIVGFDRPRIDQALKEKHLNK